MPFKKWTNLFVLLAYVIGAFFVYGKLPFTFFQQDEWAIFGNYIYWEKAQLNWWERLFIYEQGTHIIPLSNLFSFLQFKFFELNFFYYGASSILLHTINAILVYILAILITKKKIIGYGAGVMFLISSITHQAVTWVATSPGTLGATFFTLLSLIFLFKYIQSSTKKIKYIFLIVFFLTVSLLFKETSIFLFGLIPILWFLFSKRNKENHSRVFLFIFFSCVAFFIFFRIFFLLFGYESSVSPAIISQPGNIGIYAFRALTLPLKFMTQSLIPQSTLISMGGSLVKIGYPQFMQEDIPNPYIVQSVGVDIMSYMLAILIIAITYIAYLFYKIIKEERLARTILISLVCIILSSFPFVFIPGNAGYFSLIEGRHLYLSNIFILILFSTILYGFYRWIKKSKIALSLFIFVLLGLIIYNIFSIRKDINYQVGTGVIRTSILNEIFKKYPTLPRQVIFYTEGDKPYYGLPNEEKILPFQSGFGQTLLVWYNSKGENFPSCFFKEKYLYVLLEEGYKECGGRGFGYFRKKENLISAMRKEGFSVSNIIAFTYNSDKQQLTDITKNIRNEFKK